MQSAVKVPNDTTAAVYSAVKLLRRFLAHRYDFVLILILFFGFGYPASAQDNLAQDNVAQDNVAQDNVAQDSVYEFNSFTIADGLPGNRVSEIIKDSRGFIWLGTDRGLVRFDGSRFEIFTSRADDPTSLSDNDVYALLEDTEGFLWVGTAAGGLNRYDPKSGVFQRFPVSPDSSDGTSHEFINEIVQTRDGTIWIATDNGLDRYDDGRFERVQGPLEPTGLMQNAIVTNLVEDTGGVLWISSHNGVFVFDRIKGHIKLYRNDPDLASSLSNDHVNTVYLDSEKNLWVGSDGGLDVLSREQIKSGSGIFRHFEHIQGDRTSLSTNRVFAITGTTDGSIWAGTVGGDLSDGLNRINPATGAVERIRRNTNNLHGLSGNRIVSLLVDRGTNLWVGTLFSGVNNMDVRGPRFVRFDSDLNREQPLSGNEIMSLTLSGDGSLWAGTFEAECRSSRS